jgi:histidine triad (HIT) family protein
MTSATCVFCKIIAGQIPAARVFEDDHTVAFLDIAPFEKGHVLVAPKCHAAYLTDLPHEELATLISSVRNMAALLLKRLPCDGFNLVQNNGACATQTVPHVHFHIVPRWNGRAINWIPGTYEDPSELAAIHRRLTVPI